MDGFDHFVTEILGAPYVFAKYDYRFEYGDGGHNGKNGKHGGAILLESLRQWRDYAQ
jgi:hypothetical protein